MGGSVESRQDVHYYHDRFVMYPSGTAYENFSDEMCDVLCCMSLLESVVTDRCVVGVAELLLPGSVVPLS